MKRIVILLLLLPTLAMAGSGKGKPLARMLGDVLTVEQVHPDSVVPYIQRIEAAARACPTDEESVVYALCLGRLYNERQHQAHYAGIEDYARRSYQCLAYVFSKMELLANMKAKRWMPVTEKGNGDCYFSGDMLSVAWRTMLDNTVKSVRDTSTALPTYANIIRFYQDRGNADAVFLLKRDSILSEGGARQALLALCDECANTNGKLIKDELLQLSDPFIVVDGTAQAYPGKEYTWHLTTRNIASVKCDGQEHQLHSSSPYDEVEDSISWKAPLTPSMHTVTFIPASSVKTTEKMQPIERRVFVSRLKLLYQSMPDSRMQLLVVDSESGEPQEGVTISLYEDGNDSISYSTCLTDSEGRATVRIGKRNAVRVQISTENETQHIIQRLYHSAAWQAADADTVRRATLFTDRAIYRPGQQLHVGGVAYRQCGWDATVASDYSLTLILRDASYKEVERQTVTCDDMGVFSADFSLPSSCRTGSWSVRTDSGSGVSFRVEEYKRPTFAIILDDSVSLTTDSITVSGTAMNYNGTPLFRARITGNCLASLWIGRTYGDIVPLDTVYTDPSGAFSFRLHRDSLAQGLRVQVDALSSYGEQQSATQWYRISDNRPVINGEKVDSAFIFTCQSDTFCLGSPAEVSLSSNLSDIYLYYTLSANGEVITDTLIRFSNDSLHFTIPYSESYGTGAVASFCFVKGEKTYTCRQNLYLRQPDAKLQMRWDTFRNRVKPGSHEEWRLTLLHPDGTPADASMMVTLYDASLDSFKSNVWTLNVARNYRLFGLPYSETHNNRSTGHSSASYTQKRPYLKGLTLGTLNDELFSKHATVMYAASPMRLMETRVATNVVEDEAEEETAEEETAAQTIPLRQDFCEEAFFVPSLRTNHKGEVSIAFTLPESLTTWHLLGVAHTKDMLTADVDEELVATKDLMAQLRLPRFLRPGDEAQLTATVTNSTDATQTGKATLQVLLAENESILQTFNVDVNLTANADTTYCFPYTASEDDIVVRWSVEGDRGSDGEQRLLCMLPATMDVTNTMAITAFNPGTKTIDLSSLFPNDATKRKLTVEYTSHPGQYALQALAPLAVAKGNDVLSLASAYYAGRLAKSLGVSVSDSLTASYLARLKALQAWDGGFAWYPGMPSSPYLTREVGYLLSRLTKMTGDCGDLDTYQQAARYLLGNMPVPKQMETDYLRNLYVLQNANLTLTKDEASKVDSLIAMVKNLRANHTDDVEQLALASIVLKQQGEEKRARAMADAFIGRLVTVDSIGTYIEHPQGPFSSIDRKLHIHVQLMEALQTVRPDAAELSGMRRYLLRQKRTTAWETPITTANAVFALMNGREPYAPQTAGDVLTLLYNRQEVRNIIAPADSIGYVCDSMDVLSPVSELRLQKFSEGESWGSVYADFRQPLADVVQSSTGLAVTAQYPTAPQAGQRITAVYTIVANRDYDYITLSLPHPAATEAAEQLSGYVHCDGIGYYREPKDDRTELHIYHLPRGYYQLREDFYVERGGTYHTGVPTIRCDYAPEYSGHAQDATLTIQQ